MFFFAKKAVDERWEVVRWGLQPKSLCGHAYLTTSTSTGFKPVLLQDYVGSI
jgi:hypothetical protein